MKKLYTFIAAIVLTISLFAQAPEKMSYQAVIRDANNALVTNQAIGMQISILEGSINGIAVYIETQVITSNANGLVTLEIGTGTVVSGDFTAIDWGNDTYFIKTDTDPTGGTVYTITGTSQLMSVPYALHSKTAESITGTITETDPVFGVSVANGITGSDTSNWNNHTTDTDTHIDSTGIAGQGYVAGLHTVDTDTQLDSSGVAGLGFSSGSHTIDTDTHIDSTGIAGHGFIAGAHTVNTDTQLDSAGVVALGFTAGSHTVDTDTHIDSTGISNHGFVAGAHTVDTDTQLDSIGVAFLGFIAGAHTVDTDTHIDSAGISNHGFVAGAHTIDTDTQLDSAGVAALGFTAGSHTVDTDTHIDSTGISGHGFVAGSHTIEIDGDTTNEIQGLHSVLTINNDANGLRITNIAIPLNAQDAATKSYVDVLETRIDSLISSFNPLTIQERLNNGETPFQIYQSNSSLLFQIYGNIYQGGFICHLDTSNGMGIVCAPSDQGTDEFLSYAVNICNSLNLNGYSDWYLPSIIELGYMRDNYSIYNTSGFLSDYYWSSTAISSTATYVLEMKVPVVPSSGSTAYHKNPFRAVRAF